MIARSGAAIPRGSVVVCDDMLSNHFVKVLVSLVYFVNCSRIVLVSPWQSPHTESTIDKQNKIVRLSRRVTADLP
jgi:hypothetical protein